MGNNRGNKGATEGATEGAQQGLRRCLTGEGVRGIKRRQHTLSQTVLHLQEQDKATMLNVWGCGAAVRGVRGVQECMKDPFSPHCREFEAPLSEKPEKGRPSCWCVVGGGGGAGPNASLVFLEQNGLTLFLHVAYPSRCVQVT